MADDLVGDEWKYNEDYHKTANFLGVDKYDRNDLEVAKRLSFIRDWAEKKNKKNPYDQIYQLRKRLGVQDIGPTLVNQLFQHLRLAQDTEKKKKIIIKKITPQEKMVKQSVAKIIQQTLQKVMKEVLK